MEMRAAEYDRHSSVRLLVLAIGIGVLVLVGICGAALTTASKAEASNRAMATPETALPPAAATGVFGLDLMRAQPPGNLVLSPDSVAAALAMTGEGAAGRTAAQIAETLHLARPGDFAAVGKLQGAISNGQASAAKGHPTAPTLDIANGLFLQQGFPLEPAFLAGLQQHFGTAPEAVDFSGDPSGSLNRINGWVSERTRGLIPQILDSLPEEPRLVLANAVYLKAAWLHPFERSATRPAPFYNRAGKIRAEFMHETARWRYGAGRYFRAVDLPYRASTLSLLVVLPVGKPLGSLQHRLGARGLGRIVRSLSPRTVRLSLPRFHLNTQTELDETLRELGMTAAFSDSANFSRLTTAERLKIGFVKHAADFTVDEAGTVAAAATVVGAVPTSGEVTPRDAVIFNANRPFLFFLRDSRTGAVLFAGRLTDPT